jgi:hypothetical protein
MEEPLSRETVRGEVHLLIEECEALGGEGCSPPGLEPGRLPLRRISPHLAGSCLSRQGRGTVVHLARVWRALIGQEKSTVRNPALECRQWARTLLVSRPCSPRFAVRASAGVLFWKPLPGYVSVNYRSKWLHIRARRAELGPIQTCRACGIRRKRRGSALEDRVAVVSVAFCLFTPEVSLKSPEKF